MLRTIVLGVLVLITSGCPTVGTALEDATEQEFQLAKTNSALAAQVTAWRLLEAEVLDVQELGLVSAVVRGIAEGVSQPTLGGPITDALADAGLTEMEIILAFRMLESFLISSNFVQFSIDGALKLTPRTKQLLLAMAVAIEQAATITPEEVEAGSELIGAGDG